MTHYLLVLLMLTTGVFAQRQDVKTIVLKRADRLNQLIDRNIDLMTPSQLRELNQVLKTSIQKTNAIIATTTTPVPYPVPPRSTAPRAGLIACKWMPGNSHGISKRGYHLLTQVRDLYYSEKFYGNNNIESYRKCMDEVISDMVSNYELETAKTTTCKCQWYPGTEHAEPLARGYHMSYEVIAPTLEGDKNYVISTGFYGNNSTPSKEACQRELIESQFVCR